MADTRENELRKKLQDRNGNVGTKSWLSRNKEDKSDVLRAKDALESVYTEILSHASENITSEERIELQDKYSSKRFITAMQVLNRMEAKGAEPTTPIRAPKKLTQKQVAENYVDVLKNPEKYNLTEKEQDELAEVAWWSTGTADSLHPETINKSEIKNNLETQRRFSGNQTQVTEREIESAASEVRKQKIIEHYEALAQSEEGRNSSLSLNELYGLELGVRDLTLISPDYLSKLTDTKRAELLTYFKNKYPGIQKLEDAKEKILSSISEKVPMVGGLMMAGQGAQFLANPSGYLASRVVAQAGTRIATNASVQALLTSIAAMTGPVGWLARGALAVAQLFLGNILSKYLGGAISGVIDGGKKALAGAATMLLLAATALPAGATALAGASALIGLALIPIIAFIIFIINSGGYIVPPSSSVISDGGGPGSTPVPGGVTCPNENNPKPEATNVLYSSDHKYAFPLAPFDKSYYTCGHWDGNKASDMGIVGISEKGWTGRGNLPVIAYTSGHIELISLNDSLGGKYIILAGNDGRYYYYAHNCALYVTRGQQVKVGDVIATTDNTGSALNSVEHLHFAISNEPNFIYAGTICPSTDFQDKFALGRCSKDAQCPPLK